MYFLLGPFFKEGVQRAIEAMPWPEAGPPLAERRAELDKIDKDLAKLETERAELEASVASISRGVVTEPVRPESTDEMLSRVQTEKEAKYSRYYSPTPTAPPRRGQERPAGYDGGEG